MSYERSASKSKKKEDLDNTFNQKAINRIESLLSNPDLSHSQRKILENLLKKHNEKQ